MENLLERHQSEEMAAGGKAERDSSLEAKLLSFLFRDLLPSLLIIFVAGGLALPLIDFIERHRPSPPTVLVAEK